jgi:hypothetical protein
MDVGLFLPKECKTVMHDTGFLPWKAARAKKPTVLARED